MKAIKTDLTHPPGAHDLDALPILPQTPTTFEVREAMIREAAYFRALQRGFAPGHEIEDWLAAECEVCARMGTPA